MRLSEKIESTGFFWLPNDSEKKLPGTLHISESGEIRLEIIASSASQLTVGADIKRVIGIVEKLGFVTLEECLCTESSSSFSSGVSKATFFANFAYIGIGADDNDEIKFSKFTFSVDGLDEWLGISGISVERSPDFKNVSIYYTPPEKIGLQLPNNIKLDFIFSWTQPGLPIVSEAKITQKAYISLTSKTLCSIDDFLDILFTINNFFCFSIDKTVSPVSITAYSYEITQGGRGDEKREIPINIYYQSTLHSVSKPEINLREMLFRYAHVASELEKILGNWFNNYKISEPAFNLYFASKSGAHQYIESRFLSLTQGIETLHRRNSSDSLMPEDEFTRLVAIISKGCPNDKKDWLAGKLRYGNELPLRQRLKQTIQPFEKFFGNRSERKSFIDKILNTRNYLTHYDPRLEDLAASGEELWNICMKLEGLFQLHLLRSINLSDELITQLVKQNHPIRQKLKLPSTTP